MPDDKLRSLYDRIIGTGKVTPTQIGDYNTWSGLVADSNNASKFYNYMMDKGIATPNEVGDFDTFFGYVKSNSSSPKGYDFTQDYAKLDSALADVDRKVQNYVQVSPEPDANGFIQYKSPESLRNDEVYNELNRQKDYISQARDLVRQTEKYMSNPDAGTVQQFFRGLSSPLAKDFFTAGFTEMGRTMNVAEVARKAGEGQELNDNEKALLATYGTYQSALQNPGGGSYNFGQQLAMQVPYMVQFALTSGAGNAAEAGVNSMLNVTKASLPKLMKEAGYVATLKQIGKEMPGIIAKGAAQTPFMPMTYTVMGEKLAGDVSPEGEIISQPSLSEGIWKGLAQAYPEVLTESMGAHIVNSIPGVGNLIGKKAASKLTKILTPVEKFRKAAAFGNFTEEFSEEMMNNVLTPMLDPDTKFSDVWTGENILTTALTIAATGGGFYATNQAYQALDENALRRNNLSQYDKTTRDAVINAMKLDSPQEIGKALTGIIRNSNLTPSNARGILDYAWKKSMRKGMEESLYAESKEIQTNQMVNAMRSQIEPFAFKDGETLFQVINHKGEIYWVKDGQIDVNHEDGTWRIGKQPLVVVPMEGGQPTMMASTDVNSVRTTKITDHIAQQIEQFQAEADLQHGVEVGQRQAEEDNLQEAEPSFKTGDQVSFNGQRAVVNRVSADGLEITYDGTDTPGMIGAQDIEKVQLINENTGQTQNNVPKSAEQSTNSKILKAIVDKKPVDVQFTAQPDGSMVSSATFTNERDANKVVKALQGSYGLLDIVAVNTNTDPYAENNFVITAKEKAKVDESGNIPAETTPIIAGTTAQPEVNAAEYGNIEPNAQAQTTPPEVAAPLEAQAPEIQPAPEVQPPQAGETIATPTEEVANIPFAESTEKRPLAQTEPQPVSQPKPDQATTKQPWEMTFDNYFEDKKSNLTHPMTGRPYKNGLPKWFTEEREREIHYDFVKEAIQQGKSVPPEVLADYPDLKPQPEKPAEKSGKNLKENWEVTFDKTGWPEKERFKHKELVSAALEAGKEIPEDVLKEYPDLHERYLNRGALDMGPKTPYQAFTSDLGLTEDFYAIPGQAKTGLIGDVDVVVYQQDDKVVIESIRTPKGKRRQGQAKAAMQKITEAADRHGLTLTLRAVPEDKNEFSPQNLRDFYRNYGFTFIGNNGIRVPNDVSATPQKSVKEEIRAAEAQVDTNPTEEQKKAGNYQKGHIKLQGYQITIEQSKGSVRTGTDKDGKKWSTKMAHTYGYFLKSEGKDGDHIDVFIGDNPTSTKIFVVDQNDPKTGEFDESKVMMGFNSAEEAKAGYLANYEKGWKGFGQITETNTDDFKTWLYDGQRQRKPYGDYKETPQPIVEQKSTAKLLPPIEVIAGQKFIQYSEDEERESKNLESKWRDELKRMASDKSEKLRQNLLAYNKEHFFIKVNKNTGIDFITKKPWEKGEIDFSDVTSWSDNYVFFDVENKRFVPNELGRKIGIRMSEGSAFLNFNYTPENAQLVIKALQEHGYNAVDITNIEPQKPQTNEQAKEKPKETQPKEVFAGEKVGEKEGVLEPEEIPQEPLEQGDDWIAWVLDYSQDPKQIKQAWELETEHNIPFNKLEDWQVKLLSLTFSPESWNRFGDKNLVGQTFAKRWLRKGSRTIDQIAQNDLSTEDNEVTPQDVVDFVMRLDKNPGMLRKTTDTQNELAQKYKKITGKSIRKWNDKVEEKLTNFVYSNDPDIERIIEDYQGSWDNLYDKTENDPGEFAVFPYGLNDKQFTELKRIINEKRGKEKGSPVPILADESAGEGDNRGAGDRGTGEPVATATAKQREITAIKARYEAQIAELNNQIISDEELRERQRLAVKKANAGISLFGKPGEEGEQDAFAGQGAFSIDNNTIRERVKSEVEAKNKATREELSRLEKEMRAEIKLAEGQAEMPMEIEEKKPEVKPTQKIEDFGEKIEGAKKDAIKKYFDRINLNGNILSVIFPKPDIKQLLESGLSVKDVAGIKVAYEFALQEKKRKRGPDPIKFCAAYAKNILAESINLEFKNSGWSFTDYGKSQIELRTEAYQRIAKELGNEYLELDLTKARIREVDPKEQSYYVNTPKGKYEVQYYVSPRKSFDSKEEAINEFVNQIKANTVKGTIEYKHKLNIYHTRGASGDIYIGYAPKGKPFIKLKDGFRTAQEAFEYKKAHEDDLQTELERILSEQRSDNKRTVTRLKYTNETARDRIGKDWRNGKDVGSKELAETFGFRGIEFGNWVNQAERQVFVNNTYDSLMDLAQLLGIPPKAISLGGNLAISFGSRGSGVAAAHYEPGRKIINLTKTQGLGSLAHEWFHSVDNYFAGFGGSLQRMDAATWGDFTDATREEIKGAFDKVMDAINQREYSTRAMRLDDTKNRKYFALRHEMAARAFENYVLNRLKESGQINDFIVNYVSNEDWNGQPEMYPYPIGEESEKIKKAFNNLFDTIETKEEYGNTILFHLQPSDDIFYSNSIRALDAIKQDKATPEQWKAMLLKNGAKEAELDWFGWNDFVQGKRSFTKNELADWMNANRVRLDEVELGDIDSKRIEDAKNELLGRGYTIEEAEQYVSNLSETKSTKYGDYQTPGGKEYKELLITMPNKPTTVFRIYDKDAKSYVGSEYSNENDIPVGYKNDKYRIQQTDSYGQDFRSTHFDQPNIVVHVRFNSRVDANGDNVLFVEEIQSDFAQAIRAGKDNVPNMPFRNTQQWVGLALKRMVRYAAENGYDRIAWTTGEMQFDQWGSEQIDWEKRFGGTWLIAVNEQTDAAVFAGNEDALREKRLEESDIIVNSKEKLYDAIWRNLSRSKSDAEIQKITDRVWERMQTEDTGSSLPRKEGMVGFYDNIIPNTANKLFGKYGAKVGTTEINTSRESDLGKEKYRVKNEGGQWLLEGYSNNKWQPINYFDNKEDAIKFRDELNGQMSSVTAVPSLPITTELGEAAMSAQPMFRLVQNPLLSKDTEFAGDIIFGKKYQDFLEFHKQLQQMASAFGAKTGTKIIVVKSSAELPKNIYDAVVRKNRQGNYSPALFFEKSDGTQEVYLISNQNRSTDEAAMSLLHEVVGHRGLRALLKDKYDQLLKQVWAQMSEADKRKFAGLYSTADRLVIADEWLGYQAQTLGDKTPTWVQRIFGQIRQMLRDLTGMKLKFTDNDLKALFTQSRKNLERNAPARTGKLENFVGDVLTKNINNNATIIYQSENKRDETGTGLSVGKNINGNGFIADSEIGIGTPQFQIIGEQGAQRLVDAGLAVDSINNLAVAREMEAAGKSEKEIWLATGWQKGKEGKWRMEIPDHKLKIKLNPSGKLNMVADLPDVIDNPELFKAYPELKNIVVFIDSKPENYGLGGKYIPAQSFDHGTYTDHMSPEIHVTATDLSDINTILAHEIQHAVQFEEGFAQGGNPRSMQDSFLTAADINRAVYVIDHIENLIKLAKDNSITLKKANDLTQGTARPDYQDVINNIINNNSDEYVRKILNDNKQLTLSKEEKYKRLAGETEARNAQTRLTYDQAKRAATMLSESEDVDRNDQIVLMDRVQNALDLTPDIPQTETEAFKRWFGNSKVVDENGKPLVVYHGTDTKDITEFYGGWWSDDPNVTKEFGSKMYSGYLSIQNPAYDDDLYELYKEITGDEFDSEVAGMELRDVMASRFQDKLIEKGYDGIITFDDSNYYASTAFVIFSPSQIKSATGNIGTFDETNPDIRFSLQPDNDIEQKYDDLQRLAKAIDLIQTTKDRILLDANFREISEDDYENGEVPAYTDSDISEIQNMQRKAYNSLVQSIRDAGYTVETPYGSSIYITLNGKDAVSIRTHAVASSTMNHWDNVHAVNILKDGFNIKHLELYLGKPEQDNIRFSLQPPPPDIPQTETEAFKRWFGNSKVVDENGKPLVVYHGTDALFTVFDVNKQGSNTDAGWLGKGFYFYGDSHEAIQYGKLGQFYLKVENPYYATYEENNKLAELNSVDASKKFTSELIQQGYDGVYFNGNLRQEWVVFSPTQIKSATGNIGTFDETNPDIRFSLQPPPPDISQPYVSDDLQPRDMFNGKFEKAVEVTFDNQLAVKAVEDEVARLGGKFNANSHPYEAENKSRSKAQAEKEDFDKHIAEPYIKTLADIEKATMGELGYDDIRKYIIAKHAPERNAEVGKGTKVAAGSIDGVLLTDEVANFYIKSFEETLDKFDPTGELLQKLWSTRNKLTRFTLDYSLNSGWLSPTIYKQLTDPKTGYKHYVPLRGFKDNLIDQFDYLGGDLGDAYNPMKEAHGRSSEADDPSAYMISMAHTAILAGNKNYYRQQMRNLILLNPELAQQNNLFWFKKSYYILDENGNIIDEQVGDRIPGMYVEKLPDGTFNVIGEGVKGNHAKFKKAGGKWVYNSLGYNFPANMEEEIRSTFPINPGSVTTNINEKHQVRKPKSLAQQHEVEVWTNGQRGIMVFADPKVAHALNHKNNIAPKLVEGVQNSKVSDALRFMAQVLTSKNPAFWPVNMSRDIGYAWAWHAINADMDAAEFLKSIKPATQATKRFLSDKVGDNPNEIDKMYQRWRLAGGETSYFRLNNIDKIKKDIDKDIRILTGELSPTEKFGEYVVGRAGKWLDLYSQLSENISRFATYMSAYQQYRKQGLSDEESHRKAVTDSKNVTVNFDKYGRITPLLKNFYLFIGPNLGGLYNIGKLANRNKKAFLKGTVAFMLLGAVSSEITRLLSPPDDDDPTKKTYDNLNNFIKENYLVLPNPVWYFTDKQDEQFITIPMPQGFRAFYAGGVIIDDIIHGKKTLAQGLGDFSAAIGDAFMPVSMNFTALADKGITFSRAIRPAIPDVIKPITDAYWLGENFAGQAIFREPYTPDLHRRLPEYTEARSYNNQTLVQLSKMWNRLGGGDDLRSAKMSIDKDGNVVKANPLKGFFDLNPARIEYLIESYTGGVGTELNNLYKTTESAIKKSIGDDEAKIETRTIPILRRFYRGETAGTDVFRKYNELKRTFEDETYFMNQYKSAGEWDKYFKMKSNPLHVGLKKIFDKTDKASEKIDKGIDFAKQNEQSVKDYFDMKEELYKDALDMAKKLTEKE